MKEPAAKPPESGAPSDVAPQWDPTFLHARREAVWIFLLWLAAMLWTVPFSYWAGYPELESAAPAVPTVMGLPSWVFWGVVFPWLLANIVAIGFCIFYFRLDPLEASDPQGAKQLDDAAR